ncbi:hypothetical protein OpiT1DRAFT_04008 [Opitutaceae bacterium TAV1]|nr:hypothetical protein OpiT1DRAFT_04008 [Opitutaceae bacterium TAV1]
MRTKSIKLNNTPEGIARRADGRRRKSDWFVQQMHAVYMSGKSLAAVGRAFNRDRRSVREMFECRGLPLRPLTVKMPHRLPNGRIAAAAPATPEEIESIIAGMNRIEIPGALRREWRKWPLERRGEFVRRVRARLHRPEDRPDLPFSPNVEPFDYGSPHAHAIARRLNAGRNSQTKAVQIHLISQGVIWREHLYFWMNDGTPPCVGAYYSGPWRPGIGRPALHRLIWQEANGRPPPPGHVIRYRDGNPNNLLPENLVLATRNDVARENQAAALFQKSRELTALLLNRSQDNNHEHTSTLQQLHGV